MRRLLDWTISGLELVIAVVLLVFAWQLPGREEVEELSERLGSVTRDAGVQIRNLRDECARLRQRQPELETLASRLEKQIRAVGTNLQGHSLNGEGLAAMSESLGQIAEGLEGIGTSLDANGVANIAKGLGATAVYLEEKLMPVSAAAAASLEKAATGLKTDATRLAKLLQEKPTDFKAVKLILDQLARFEEGLGRMSNVTQVENFEKMRTGMEGLHTALNSGAEQVDHMGTFKLPQMSFRGLVPSVVEKDFWPNAKTVAEGMRKAAKGCEAAGKEMESFNKELPKFSASLKQSQKVVASIREVLTKAIEQEEMLEPLLRRLPKQLAQLTEDLPRLTEELAKILRETDKLKEIATAMRQAEKSMQIVVERWPELRKGLEKSSLLLRQTRKQLNTVLARRDEFEEMINQSVQLTTMFAAALPLLIGNLESGLERQENSLHELGQSIDRVAETIPAASSTAKRLLTITRWLLTLVSLMVALHAAYVLLGERRRLS